MNSNKPIDYQSVESRRSSRSDRRMTPLRRLYYFLGLPVMRGVLRLLTATYRVETVLGSENIEPFLDGKRSCAPAYWHQHHVLCSTLVRGWIRRGFRACFLVSGSVDGEVPERIARSWGAEVIRGSANQSGALALRDMQTMMKRGYSIVTTADGPRGPRYEIKPGVVVMARIGKVPVLPIACAADKAWYLDRWDRFMIPKPFSRVVMAIGEPISVPDDVPLDEIEPYRLNVQEAVMSLMRESEDRLQVD
ncbi:MAG: lysophospholipid acyltransferase family protein [Gammaproteobacteria bacterium]|nr:lysophospholipid acyltransferase family protein [Gammaproteobacteria bacterium]